MPRGGCDTAMAAASAAAVGGGGSGDSEPMRLQILAGHISGAHVERIDLRLFGLI
jgi:hypothetical protein